MQSFDLSICIRTCQKTCTIHHKLDEMQGTEIDKGRDEIILDQIR